MSFLKRARHAAEQARQVASETASQARQVAGEAAVTAKQVAGEAAVTAKQVAIESANTAKQAALETSSRAQATMRDPATKQKAQASLKLARKGIATAVERIDPGVLADVIIKATSLQERANASLRSKGSPYRIAEIAIGAAIPPSITFSIGRVDDPDHNSAAHASAPHLASEPLVKPADGAPVAPITTLDGTEIEDTDLAELADGT